MANNYLQFSESIDNLTPDEEKWLTKQLEEIAVIGGKEYSYEFGDGTVEIDGKEITVDQATYRGCRAYLDMPDYDPDMMRDDAGFDYEFDDGSQGRYLWIGAEEYGDLECVGHFVMKFLRQFRPKDYWVLTYAVTCSKPRIGEFGGGALFVTAQEAKYEGAYEFIEREKTLFEANKTQQA